MITTTFIERFGYLMELLCCERPSDKMIQDWFDGTDNDSLQQFAVEHGPDCIQGIGLIDGVTIMADQPPEGEGHELRNSNK